MPHAASRALPTTEFRVVPFVNRHDARFVRGVTFPGYRIP